ncbi:MAG: hypothetical protein WCL16_09520 [bacterium]
MNNDNSPLLKEFEQRYTPSEREELARCLLDEALLEVVCAGCGRYALTLRRGQLSGTFECPGCHKRTFAILNAGQYSIFSETRLFRLIRYASGKRWYCPEHDGVPVSIVQVQSGAPDPRHVTLHYLCKRGNRFFGRQRTHAGTIPLDLMSIEAEMLAEA